MSKLFFLYLMLHILNCSGIFYPVFMTNTIISVLQINWVVPVWSSNCILFCSFVYQHSFCLLAPAMCNCLCTLYYINFVNFIISNNSLKNGSTPKLVVCLQFKWNTRVYNLISGSYITHFSAFAAKKRKSFVLNWVSLCFELSEQSLPTADDNNKVPSQAF